MDALAVQSPIHNVRISSETQRYPDYVSSETNLHSHPSILNTEHLCRMHPKCSTGIGKFENYGFHIKLEDNVKPVVHPVRKTALALRGKLEKRNSKLWLTKVSLHQMVMVNQIGLMHS